MLLPRITISDRSPAEIRLIRIVIELFPRFGLTLSMNKPDFSLAIIGIVICLAIPLPSQADDGTVKFETQVRPDPGVRLRSLSRPGV